MKLLRPLLICTALLLTLSSAAQSPSSPIIADHRAVAAFDDIPPQYLAQVRQMLLYVAGESHSTAYCYGPQLLAAQSTAHPAVGAMMDDVQYFGDPTPSYPAFNPANPRLRVIRGYGGEDAWFTNTETVTTVIPPLLERYSGQGVTAIGFGWCWDMTWIPESANIATQRDPVYRVHWSGRSVSGPQGDICWGLDAEDFAVTGNSVNLDTYLTATQSYVDYCSSHGLAIKPFFTTGPVDDSDEGGAYDQNEKGYARELKHARIRAWVTAHNGILFDFAAILSHNSAGQAATGSWTDDLGRTRTFPVFHPDNGVVPFAPYHFGEVGAVRVAKALWWMLARMAGWDGVPANALPTVIPRPQSMTQQGSAWTMSASERLAVIIGTNAGDVEQYAAAQFAALVQRRFSITCDIHRPGDNVTDHTYRILLGTRASNTAVDAFATAQAVSLGAATPGPNGFAIAMAEAQGVRTIMVGGCDVNGTLYGQDTLFQLFSQSGSTIRLACVSVRDFPSFAEDRLGIQFYDFSAVSTSTLDVWARARYNDWVLRSYIGTEDQMRERVPLAKRRGISCRGELRLGNNSVTATNANATLAERFVANGCDGFFLGVDDDGSATVGAGYLTVPQQMAQYVALMQRLGIPDRRVIFLPGCWGDRGSYYAATSPDNQNLVAIAPSLRNYKWIFTAAPGADELAATTALPLAAKPLWWYNWPFPRASFANNHAQDCMVPIDPAVSFNAYREPIPLDQTESPWFRYTSFTVDSMRNAGTYCSGALISLVPRTTAAAGTTVNYPQEYFDLNFGAWMWNPPAYDPIEVRDHIYALVFSPELVPAAQRFDANMVALRAYFRVDNPEMPTRPFPLIGNRAEATALAQGMADSLALLRANTRSTLDSSEYLRRYIGPMQDAVDTIFAYIAHGGPADTTPPSVPTNLAGTATSSTTVDLTWTASTDAVGVTGYRIYRDGTQIGTATGTSYADTELTAATQYAYRVAAYDQAGNGSNQSTAITVTTQAPPSGDTVLFEGFESPVTAAYVYNPTANWQFIGNSGIQRNGSAWEVPNAPEGVQTAFLQSDVDGQAAGAIQRTISFPAGVHTISLRLARRLGQIQPLRAGIDGTQIGTLLTPTSDDFALYTTEPFTVTAGNHTVRLETTATGADLSTMVDDLRITQQNPATFTAWRTANFIGSDLTNDTISGRDADPDGAGLSNFARYALALPARGPVANPITTGTATSAGASYLTLTFPRRTTATGLSYIVEASTDLATWTAVPDRTYTAGSGPITAQDAVAIGTVPRRFLRLRVTEP